MHSDIDQRTDGPTTGECVLLGDGEGTIVWSDPDAADVLGRPEADITGRTVASLLGPSVPDPPQRGTAPVTDSLAVPADDGEVRDITVTVDAIDAPGAATVYRCRRTVNEQLSIYDVLSRVEDGVVAFDTEWHYTYANETAEELLGRSSAELHGEVIWDMFPKTAGTDVEDEFRHAMATQEPSTLETYTDSLERWVEVRIFPSSTGASVYFRDISARKAREDQLRRERDLTQQLFRLSPTGIAVHSPDGRFVRINERAEDIIGIDREDLLDTVLEEPIWDARGPDGEPFPDEQFPLNVVLATGEPCFGTEMSAKRGEDDRFWISVSAAPVLNDDGDIERVIVGFEEITERKADEEQLAAQRDELIRLNDINALIRGVHRTVVGATDRETVERAVCDRLATSESHPVALTTRLTGGEATRVEHAAGLSDEVLAALRADGATCLEAAIDRASAATAVTVLSELQTDDAHHPALRDLAADHGLRALGNIPIEADGVVYGVLTVGSTHSDAFTGRERTVFAELGQLLGTAIEAIRTKRLLYATDFLELDISASADVEPLAALNARVGGQWRLDGVVPVESCCHLLYVDVGETPVADVERAADGIAGVDALRRIEAGSGHLLELRVVQDTPVSGLLDAGGRIRSGTVEGGAGQFVVDITVDTDVRGYLDRLEQRGIEVSLLAKREVERTALAARAVTDTDTELTARQRTVLEAAYLSGYFDWPRRRTTGEELADALDIASSTLHQHLRVASGKVFEQYFDGSAAGAA